MRARYRFTGRWEVHGPTAEVHRLLVDLAGYPLWWPQVVAVASLGEDDARVLCRSVLPYRLDLLLHAVDRSSDRLEVAVSGDLDGAVVFGLAASPAGTTLTLEQEVEVVGRLAAASYLLRPLLTWNHHRMMAGCVAGLRRQLRSSAGRSNSEVA